MDKLELNETVLWVLDNHGAEVENAEGKEGCLCSADVRFEDNGWDYVVSLLYDGTAEDFLKKLQQACYDFDPYGYTDYDESEDEDSDEDLYEDEDFDGVTLDVAMEIKERLWDLADDLTSYALFCLDKS